VCAPVYSWDTILLYPYVGRPVPKRTRVKDYLCLRLKYNTSFLANFLTQYISHVKVLKCILQGYGSLSPDWHNSIAREGFPRGQDEHITAKIILSDFEHRRKQIRNYTQICPLYASYHSVRYICTELRWWQTCLYLSLFFLINLSFSCQGNIGTDNKRNRGEKT
jgi:hypothetical protein